MVRKNTQMMTLPLQPLRVAHLRSVSNVLTWIQSRGTRSAWHHEWTWTNTSMMTNPRRTVVDFDLAKECSISLLRNNVYACLVCGVYFVGRGKRTHAYTHSLQSDHHVFVNLATKRYVYMHAYNPYKLVDASQEVSYLYPSSSLLLDSTVSQICTKSMTALSTILERQFFPLTPQGKSPT